MGDEHIKRSPSVFRTAHRPRPGFAERHCHAVATRRTVDTNADVYAIFERTGLRKRKAE